MHLALTLVIGVLFIIQAQSQAPDVCQMHIKSFLSYIQRAAQSVDKEKYPSFYAKVSMLAKTIGEFIEARTMQRTATTDGLKKCEEAKKQFSLELASIYNEMKETNDSTLHDAVENIDKAIQFMQNMEKHLAKPKSSA